MRKFIFQLYSDMHLEFYTNYPFIKPLAPTLFLAGDIGHYNKTQFKNFFDYCSPRWKTIVYVLGNHEFYIDGNTIDDKYNKYKKFFNNYNNIYLLNNSFVRIEDINIYGSTLWTQPTLDLISAKKYFNNFNKIEYMDIQKTSNLQYNSLKNYIENNKKKTIIISHFPPLQKNTSAIKYLNQEKIIKDYFAWEHLIDEIPNKNIIGWLSGHTHHSYDFNYKNIRLLSNQIGYKKELNKNTFNIDGLYEIIIKNNK